MSLIEEMNALLESANKNEGLPPELDKAVRQMKDVEMRKRMLRWFVSSAKLDLNKIKTSQIKSARGIEKGKWTLVIHFGTDDTTDPTAWRYYNPQGEVVLMSSSAEGKSFKKLIDGGAAFVIDADTDSVKDKKASRNTRLDDYINVVKKVDTMLSKIGYTKQKHWSKHGTLMTKGKYGIEVWSMNDGDWINVALIDTKHDNKTLDVKDINMRYTKNAEAEVLKIVKNFIGNK